MDESLPYPAYAAVWIMGEGGQQVLQPLLRLASLLGQEFIAFHY